MGLLSEEFKKHVASAEQVINIAVERKLARIKKEQVKTTFSQLVEETLSEAYSIYLESEDKSWQKAIAAYINQKTHSSDGRVELILLLQKNFKDFDNFFLSVFQSRKPRAGGAFETIIRILFRRLDYPFEEQQIINGKPDFLLPNRKHYDENAMDCIIFTAKRTLRERWRQIVTEGTRGRAFYLATIDDEITPNQLEEMKKNRIYIVVPASLKKEIEHYKSALNVLTFEDFFEDHLDPALRRWKKAGII